MTIEEQEDWKRINYGNLYVSKNYFHHHAQNILKNHSKTAKKLSDSFESTIPVKTTIRSKKKPKTKTRPEYKEYFRGINADDLNKRLRELLTAKHKDEIKFEVVEKRGVFYFSEGKGATGGFDFAIINNYMNITTLRNLCFGEVHYNDGQKKWNDFLSKNPNLISIANEIKESCVDGVDIKYEQDEQHMPLILGEIQFGNWGLVYRDFFKVLKANVQNSIDCLVYIVPTGNLQKLLSGGIVVFDDTVRIIKEFEKVISVPIWVIGLDIEV